MARRASLTDLALRVDITRVLQAIQTYRRLLGEVLLASFFLQVLGLVLPLLFQVVPDKVLTHIGYSTRATSRGFGIVTVTIFETVLGGLRTDVFSRTTDCIDVELGAGRSGILAAGSVCIEALTTRADDGRKTVFENASASQLREGVQATVTSSEACNQRAVE
ncbi:hypothetical protein [Bradyrhizobium sp. ORS 285]|uniref:hypothetical protein n=1 Tax=Bradyrhizobium sp. ORS 285 TaxID=115808 RepID=UPI000553D906|nr:hypothetical protein [Bradyrhizobium sp. ORS 285]